MWIFKEIAGLGGSSNFSKHETAFQFNVPLAKKQNLQTKTTPSKVTRKKQFIINRNRDFCVYKSMINI